MTARQQLEAAATTLGLDLTAAQVDGLFAYLDLIQKWNKVYNLTSVRDPADMLLLHVVDSLAIIAPLARHLAKASAAEKADALAKANSFAAAGQAHPNAPASPPSPTSSASSLSPAAVLQAGRRLLDVGSGAGLPGIVVAICCPDIAVTCVDTVAKKAAFINQVAVSLKLKNLKGVHARVENLAGQTAAAAVATGGAAYDVICCRAFSSLADFAALSQTSLKTSGIWLAMKARHPADEIAQLPPNVEVFHVEPLTVPGLQAERCIVWMRKV